MYSVGNINCIAFIFIISIICGEPGDPTAPKRGTAKVPPKLSRSVSFERNQVVVGSKAVASCVVVNGDFPITFVWLKDGVAVSELQGITFRQLNDYSSQLTIAKTQKAHTGYYTCVAKNSAGEDTQTLQLTVIDASTVLKPTPSPGQRPPPPAPKEPTQPIYPPSGGTGRGYTDQEKWELEKKVLQLQAQKLQLEIDCMTKNRGFCAKIN